jgi:hypothetical protein
MLWPEPQLAPCKRIDTHSSDGSIKGLYCSRHKVIARVVTVDRGLRKLIRYLFIDVSADPIVYYPLP